MQQQQQAPQPAPSDSGGGGGSSSGGSGSSGAVTCPSAPMEAAEGPCAPTWAELNGRLAALLARLQAPGSKEESIRYRDECSEWRAAALVAHAAGGDPTPVERQALVGTVLRAGDQLAALDLQPGAVALLVPACSLIIGCSLLAVKYCDAPEAGRFATCLALVLNSGARALEAIPQTITPAVELGCEVLLSNLAAALGNVLSLLTLASPSVASCCSVLPPQCLTRWWEAAAGALEACERMRGGPGTISPDVAANCVGVLCCLSDSQNFVQHQGALHTKAALCGRLARLLLHPMAAIAIGLQLPQERRSSGCSWARAEQYAEAVWFLCVADGAEAVLANSGSILPLLKTAMQLAAHAPAGPALSNALGLLARAACFAWDVLLPQRQLPPQQMLQLALQLSNVLPKYALAAASDGLGVSSSLVQVAGLLAKLLLSPLPFSLADARACCAGASAALRLLKPLQLIASSQPAPGQPPDADHAHRAASAIRSVCHLARTAWIPWAAACRKLRRDAGQPAEAPQAAEDCAELWQLHSALCRAAHAAAGDCNVLLEAAGSLLASVYGVVAPLVREGRAPAAVEAMTVAHFELLRAVVLEPSAAASFDAATAMAACCGLAAAVGLGPPAISAHPDTEAMFARLAQSLPEVGDFDMLFAIAADSPAIASHLVLCGGYGKALQQAHSTSDAPQMRNVAAAAIHAAAELLVVSKQRPQTGSSAEHATSGVLDASLQQAINDVEASIATNLLIARAAADDGAFLQARQARRLLDAVRSLLLPAMHQLAAALLVRCRRPELAETAALELARAAAARSCAYLRCANLAGVGGPAAGQGEGSSRCSACRAVWYCDETCSHADWRGPSGHRHLCAKLGAERAAAKAAAAAQRRAGGVSGAGGRGA